MPFIATALSTIAGGTAAAGTATAGATSGISFSSVLSAGSAILGGLAEFQASKQAAAIANANAKIAEGNKLRAIQESRVAAQDQDTITAAFVGEQLSKQGASGLSVESRSFVRTRQASRRSGRIDTLRVIDRGLVEATDFGNQAALSRSEASGFKTAGGFSLFKAGLGATGSIISAARPVRPTRIRSFV